MIAPEEFSRNGKTVSGETAAAITQRKPTTLEDRMAAHGHPALVDRDQLRPAPPGGRPARTASGEAVYIPEFRQDSTAVSTTAFMIWSAYGDAHHGEGAT